MAQRFAIECPLAGQVIFLEIPVHPYQERRPCNDGTCEHANCPAYDNQRFEQRRKEREEQQAATCEPSSRGMGM